MADTTSTEGAPAMSISIITSDDVRRQVREAVDAQGDTARGIDADGAAREIVERHGLVDIDTLDDADFWTIVARHDTTQLVAVTDPEAGDYGVHVQDPDGVEGELVELPPYTARIVLGDAEGEEIDAIRYDGDEQGDDTVNAALAAAGYTLVGDWSTLPGTLVRVARVER